MTNIPNILTFTDKNNDTYNLKSIVHSQGPIHFVAMVNCQHDNNWYLYDNQLENRLTHNSNFITSINYLDDKQTYYLIYLKGNIDGKKICPP